jgi:hypothetical protein
MPIFLKYVSVLSTEIRRRGLSQKAATAASTTGLTSPVAANASPLSGDSSGISSKPTSASCLAKVRQVFPGFWTEIEANVAVLVICADS